MRIAWAAAVVVLFGLLSEPDILRGQVSTQGGQYRGMFGDRTLGQPIGPRSSRFAGGIQTGTSGNFLYRGRTDNSSMFAAPWRRPQPNVELDFYGNALGPQVGPQLTGMQALAPRPAIVPEVAAPEVPAPEVPAPEVIAPEVVAPEVAVPEVITPEVATPQVFAPPVQPALEGAVPGVSGETPGESAAMVGPAAGTPFVVLPPAPPRLGGPRSVSLGTPRPATRSATLSERLTRIARTSGSLASGTIDVYLSGGGAVLEGTVRSEHSRTLLSHVVGLEPQVAAVDNRLVVVDGARSR